jgi:hypothetical protein
MRHSTFAARSDQVSDDHSSTNASPRAHRARRNPLILLCYYNNNLDARVSGWAAMRVSFSEELL